MSDSAGGWQVEFTDLVLRVRWPGGQVEFSYSSIVEVVPRIGRKVTELDFKLAAPSGGRLRVNMETPPEAEQRECLRRLLDAVQGACVDHGRDGAMAIPAMPPMPAAPPALAEPPPPIRGPEQVPDHDDWLILEPLRDTGLLARGELVRPTTTPDGDSRR